MVQLHRHRDELAERGGELVIIGNGAPSYIAGFREHTGYRGLLYTDPTRAAYRALALERSVSSTFNPRAVGQFFTALRGGFRQRRTQGDPWQQGGVFVVSTDGRVTFAHRSRFAGDKAPISAIVAGLDAAAMISRP